MALDPIVFYDGHCGLCHHFVRFVVKKDGRAVFRFAPLAGTTFSSRVPEAARGALPDSVVVVTPDNRLLTKSEAVRYVLGELGGIWSALGALLSLIPRVVGDTAYDVIARTRRQIFAPPSDVCPLMPPELRSRFGG